jgi:lipopolysaccharide biosynthesis glycosyltransferase
MNKDVINIACTCDDNYVVMLCAMIKSMETNHITNEPINIYIIDNSIANENRAKLQKSINSNKIKLIWNRITNETLSTLTTNDKNVDLTRHYSRLLIPYILPEHIEKVIYLDCDLLILDDIAELWKLNIDGFPIAAVQDSGSGKIGDGWQIPNYRELGLNPDFKYFNSGVLIIDLKTWRQENFSEQIIKCTEKNIEHVVKWDQYGFNVVFHGRWKELRHEWNFFQYNSFRPRIVHFVMAMAKPIYPSYKGNYSYEFFDYLDKTEWKNWRPYKTIEKNTNIKAPEELPNLVSRLCLQGSGAVVGTRNTNLSEKILQATALKVLFSIVDPDSGIEAVSHLMKFGSRSVIMKTKSLEAVEAFKNNYFDFIYLDIPQNNDGFVEEIECWWKTLRFGGLCAFGGSFQGQKVIHSFTHQYSLTSFSTNRSIDDDFQIWYLLKEVNKR